MCYYYVLSIYCTGSLSGGIAPTEVSWFNAHDNGWYVRWELFCLLPVFCRVLSQHSLSKQQWEDRVVTWYSEHKGMTRFVYFNRNLSLLYFFPIVNLFILSFSKEFVKCLFKRPTQRRFINSRIKESLIETSCWWSDDKWLDRLVPGPRASERGAEYSDSAKSAAAPSVSSYCTAY